MKTLIVGFSTHRSVFSWLIRIATKSKISHTYIRLLTPFGEDVIFQASGLSVNYCNGNYFRRNHKVLYEYKVEIPDDQWDRAERFRVTEVGKPYSMKQIVGFGYMILMHALGRKVSNPFSDGDHSYICTEVVAVCLGIEGAESMSPEDLWRWCLKSPNATRIVSKLPSHNLV